jgi:small-conductance mechanosensitive channel
MTTSRIPRFARVLAALAALWLIAAPAAVWALDGGPVEAAVSAVDLEALVSTLEDPGERAELVRQLRAILEGRRGAGGTPHVSESTDILTDLSDSIEDASRAVVDSAAIVVEIPRLFAWAEHEITDPDERARWLGEGVKLAVMLILALLAEWLSHLLLRAPRRAIEGYETDTIIVRAPFLLARTVVDLAPVAVFAVIAYATLSLVEPRVATSLIALALVNANVIARALQVLARMVFAPRVANLRLIPLTDESANYGFIWARRIVNTAVYGYILTGTLPFFDVPGGVGLVVLNLIGFAVAVMLVILVLQNRGLVADCIRGDEDEAGTITSLRHRFGEIWHVLAIIYVGGIYGVWVLHLEGGFNFILRASALTVVILGVAKALAILGHALVDRGFALSPDVKRRFPTLEARTNRYLGIFHLGLQVAIYGFAFFTVLQAWGVDTFVLLASEAGRGAISSVLTILTILVVAVAMWEAVSSIVEYYLSRVEEGTSAPGRATRLKTFLPLARRALSVVLAVMVTLTVLSQLGINIAPLLAGAGVVGLAVGFGAQTLVKDVITGVFMLLEDTVAVGDVVSVGGHSGTVEGVSIRTIRLRDLSGTVYIIPFSEVTSVTNMTKDFAFALMEIGVAYREDVDDVIAVLKEIGAGMRADKAYAASILEDLDILGLDRFENSAVVIKLRIKTVAIMQWGIRREFQRRIKRRFDELGIEIPFPHTTLYFGEDKAGEAPTGRLQVTQSASAAHGAGAPPPRKPAPSAAPPPAEASPEERDAARAKESESTAD